MMGREKKKGKRKDKMKVCDVYKWNSPLRCDIIKMYIPLPLDGFWGVGVECCVVEMHVTGVGRISGILLSRARPIFIFLLPIKISWRNIFSLNHIIGYHKIVNGNKIDILQQIRRKIPFEIIDFYFNHKFPSYLERYFFFVRSKKPQVFSKSLCAKSHHKSIEGEKNIFPWHWTHFQLKVLKWIVFQPLCSTGT